ncbi:hypothetical protein AZE42_06830 [Rhizopogon vesiculosus]|uniref:TFIIS-type domain-containing protein n=1 Tax=Rhizopogon vesiculosus TaxID=180088 RepID=A0A1J8QB88_9AGAM|nr:hypothetical protein AZE42_06830 [Rhizopogon vesiculosus]
MKRKEVDDVLGGEETWRDADSTAITCDKCGHPRAYFYQLQIRSADEPMTTYALDAHINGVKTNGFLFKCMQNAQNDPELDLPTPI